MEPGSKVCVESSSPVIQGFMVQSTPGLNTTSQHGPQTSHRFCYFRVSTC